jgi:chromosome segregation ATPase
MCRLEQEFETLKKRECDLTDKLARVEVEASAAFADSSSNQSEVSKLKESIQKLTTENIKLDALYKQADEDKKSAYQQLDGAARELGEATTNMKNLKAERDRLASVSGGGGALVHT